ncbi:MAG: GGDEF domain-containing protein [Chloroflexota bacterium]
MRRTMHLRQPVADPDHDALDRQLARALSPIAFVLSAMYASSVIHRLADPALAAATSPTAIVPTVAFLVMGLLLRFRPLPSALANPVLLISLGLLTVETLGRGEVAAGVNLHWALIGLGAVVLRPRWAVGSVLAIWAPWFVAAVGEMNTWSLGHGAFVLDMVTATALGVVVFNARRRAVVGLVAARRDLQELVLADPLTRLHNRRGIEHAAIDLMRRHPGRPLALLFVDLDGFKSINDRLGHAEGDRALVAMADVLRDTFRADDIVGRVGGDEFVVLLSPASDVATAARRLEQQLAAWNDAADRSDLGASVGSGSFTGPTLESFWAAVDAADRRMYAAKHARRARRGQVGQGASADDPATIDPAAIEPTAIEPTAIVA